MELSDGTAYCHTCTLLASISITNGDVIVHSDGSLTINSTYVNSLFVANENNVTFLCLPMSKGPSSHPPTSSNLITKYQDYITLILCIFSICFLILFFIAFFMVKRMRNIPGCTIAGNMLMFLLAYIVFLCRGLLQYYPNDIACKIVAVMINYFFIAAFVFMNLYAILIIRSLEFIELDSRYTPLIVVKIWLTGLLVPFLVLVPAILLDNYASLSKFAPQYGGVNCFMESREGNIVFFILPIAVCLLIAMVIYVVVVLRLRHIAAATSRVRQSHKEKVYLCFKLIIVLGFNWLSAMLAAAVDRYKYPIASQILTTIFIVLCCLHGFFGFLVFVASGSNMQNIKAKYHQLKSDSTNSTSNNDGKSSRLYSGVTTSTSPNEFSTMIGKSTPRSSPPSSPVPLTKFNDNGTISPQGYKSITETATPNSDSGLSGDDKPYNVSPVSTRSTSSKQKCDFF